MASPASSQKLAASLPRLESALESLRLAMLAAETEAAVAVAAAAPRCQPSARNLLHYQSLRRHELRPLRQELSRLGLATFDRGAAQCLAEVEAVLETVRRLTRGEALAQRQVPPPSPLLERHAFDLLGSPPSGRGVRIVVTLPAAAAQNRGLVDDLLVAGMDAARIDCGEDEPAAWLSMAENVRRAERDLGRPCRLLFDLAGPRLRTGALGTAEPVLRIGVRKDRRGTVVRPARVLLWAFRPGHPSPQRLPADAELPVSPELVSAARIGDTLDLKDIRGRRRRLRVAATGDGFLIGELERNAYLEQGTRLRLLRDGRPKATGQVGPLPPAIEPLRLRPGDEVLLTGDDGRRLNLQDEEGWPLAPAVVPCNLGPALADLEPGDRVWFDDGKIGAVVGGPQAGGVRLRITQASPEGSKLRPDRAIHLPDSALRLRGLTPRDVAQLPLVAEHGDLVGLSMVQGADDVLELEERLRELGAAKDRRRPGLVLKIETRRGFEALPEILLAGLRWPPVGLLVARGELAVEMSFARLAEAQEQILTAAEAAHVPVLWTTHVLEEMARGGIPPGYGLTDAALALRAEAVLLERGPYLVETVRYLSDVLERSHRHQKERRAKLQPLPALQEDETEIQAPDDESEPATACRL